MKRVALVVGHNSVSQGAVRADTDETEFVFNGDLAIRIEAEASYYDDIEVKTFFRQPGLGYRGEIRRVYEETDRWGAHATVELHFNSSSDTSATGTETLTSGTPASMALATSINTEMVAALGLRDRGVKTRSASDRGGASLMSGRAPAILIEPFFGSCPADQEASKSVEAKQRLAEAIMRGVAASIGAMPRTDAEMPESRTLTRTKGQRRKIATAALATAGTVGLTPEANVMDALGIADQIGMAIPVLRVVLPLALVGLLIWMRMDTDAIEEARWDDQEKGLR